jgi:hypothetical protein
MVTASLISRLSQAIDQIETRRKQNRPLKVVTVRRCLEEDPNAALDRHYAAHPAQRDADVVIFDFCFDEELAAKSQVAPRRVQTAELKDRDP